MQSISALLLESLVMPPPFRPPCVTRARVAFEDKDIAIWFDAEEEVDSMAVRAVVVLWLSCLGLTAAQGEKPGMYVCTTLLYILCERCLQVCRFAELGKRGSCEESSCDGDLIKTENL